MLVKLSHLHRSGRGTLVKGMELLSRGNMENDFLTGYARVALEASRLAATGTHPVKAWSDRAADVFVGRPEARVKSCPKSAFLGLAAAGLINGVPPGAYTRSLDNRRYAEAAVQRLREDATWAADPQRLWSAVAEQAGKKRHNGQMNVVIALWCAGAVRKI
ncbi:hypothetical protein ABIB42_000303 [Massilia sp. UYP32]|uniref:DUF6979 family protein n=1 Tax=Massilia sp. UYP32 TaxID=1756386 RepID=UPI003D20838F